MHPVTIIGVDCATQPKNIGLALGGCAGEQVWVEKVVTNQDPVATILSWLPTENTLTATLLAMDAPLGWPAALGKTLVSHVAGIGVAPAPNHLFRRKTDRFIKEAIGKQSLDVGADRIARTAHAALGLLAALRKQTKRPISLAWHSSPLATLSAIEVYPAATLKVLFAGERVPSYKGRGGENGRLAILHRLQTELTLPANTDLLAANDDALDAAVTILAGADFLQDKTMPPTDLLLAQKEGWMWVRKPNE